jgi:hypothetical protein
LCAEEYLKEKDKERRETEYKYYEDVNKKKQRNIKIAFGLVANTGMFRNTFRNMVEGNLLRFFNSTLNEGRAFAKDRQEIYIPLDKIHDPLELFRIIVHELIHIEYHADDLSTEMQSLQGQAMKRLLEYAYRFMSPKVLIQTAEQ